MSGQLVYRSPRLNVFSAFVFRQAENWYIYELTTAALWANVTV
jgi:hypothetical protein